MRHTVAVTAAQQADIIDALRDVRQERGDFDPGLAVLLKWPHRRKQFVFGDRAAGLESAE